MARLRGRLIAFVRRHKEITGEPEGVSYTFSYRVKGGGCIMDDAAVMLSGKMYREFCVPYNACIAATLDGALGHFCGEEVAAKHKVCVLWDGELPEGCEHIITGVIHKPYRQKLG